MKFFSVYIRRNYYWNFVFFDFKVRVKILVIISSWEVVGVLGLFKVRVIYILVCICCIGIIIIMFFFVFKGI